MTAYRPTIFSIILRRLWIRRVYIHHLTYRFIIFVYLDLSFRICGRPNLHYPTTIVMSPPIQRIPIWSTQHKSIMRGIYMIVF